MQNRAIGWYFETVNRLQYTYSWPHYLVMKSEVPDEKPIVLRVEKAIETGNFEERIGVISNTPTGDVRQCFFPVMKKRNYNVNNIVCRSSICLSVHRLHCILA